LRKRSTSEKLCIALGVVFSKIKTTSQTFPGVLSSPETQLKIILLEKNLMTCCMQFFTIIVTRDNPEFQKTLCKKCQAGTTNPKKGLKFGWEKLA
jgi:hypothetical protein